MNILGIEGLRCGVSDPQACARFLLDWGFAETPSAAGRRFATAEGSWIEVLAQDDAALPALNHHHPAFDGSCVREVIWGVDEAATLDAIDRDGGLAPASGRGDASLLRGTDPAGNAVGFTVSRRVIARSEGFSANVPGATPARVDRPAEGASKELVARPVRLNHLVYMAPSVQASVELARFYQDRLGFRLSDAMGGKGFFMRPAGSRDHHNLLVECFGEGHRGVQHLAVEYRDLDHLMHRGTHIERQGWQSHVGPGRHTLGSNFTWYFWSPLGGLMELVADMDQLTAQWQPRDIDPARAGPPWAWLARPFPEGFRFGIAPRRG